MLNISHCCFFITLSLPACVFLTIAYHDGISLQRQQPASNRDIAYSSGNELTYLTRKEHFTHIVVLVNDCLFLIIDELGRNLVAFLKLACDARLVSNSSDVQVFSNEIRGFEENLPEQVYRGNGNKTFDLVY